MVILIAIIALAILCAFVLWFFSHYVWCDRCHTLNKIITEYTTEENYDKMRQYCVCKKCGKILIDRTYTDFEELM